MYIFMKKTVSYFLFLMLVFPLKVQLFQKTSLGYG